MRYCIGIIYLMVNGLHFSKGFTVIANNCQLFYASCSVGRSRGSNLQPCKCQTTPCFVSCPCWVYTSEIIYKKCTDSMPAVVDFSNLNVFSTFINKGSTEMS